MKRSCWRFEGRPGMETPFFTDALQDAGYTTGMAGKWFAGSVFNPPVSGFDESLVMVRATATGRPTSWFSAAKASSRN